ncbi:uncharacterized protein LOC131957825 [Physella acuta]|uniref:uncharacterized protein LOC131957825 n=1 Tax=Physella acuta TaxID=109671 RepID=UPI0027DD1EFC|nr:uncharacterized protein LOC131957825 [Physella acuta]
MLAKIKRTFQRNHRAEKHIKREWANAFGEGTSTAGGDGDDARKKVSKPSTSKHGKQKAEKKHSAKQPLPRQGRSEDASRDSTADQSEQVDHGDRKKTPKLNAAVVIDKFDGVMCLVPDYAEDKMSFSQSTLGKNKSQEKVTSTDTDRRANHAQNESFSETVSHDTLRLSRILEYEISRSTVTADEAATDLMCGDLNMIRKKYINAASNPPLPCPPKASKPLRRRTHPPDETFTESGTGTGDKETKSISHESYRCQIELSSKPYEISTFLNYKKQNVEALKTTNPPSRKEAPTTEATGYPQYWNLLPFQADDKNVQIFEEKMLKICTKSSVVPCRTTTTNDIFQPTESDGVVTTSQRVSTKYIPELTSVSDTQDTTEVERAEEHITQQLRRHKVTVSGQNMLETHKAKDKLEVKNNAKAIPDGKPPPGKPSPRKQFSRKFLYDKAAGKTNLSSAAYIEKMDVFPFPNQSQRSFYPTKDPADKSSSVDTDTHKRETSFADDVSHCETATLRIPTPKSSIEERFVKRAQDGVKKETKQPKVTEELQRKPPRRHQEQHYRETVDLQPTKKRKHERLTGSASYVICSEPHLGEDQSTENILDDKLRGNDAKRRWSTKNITQQSSPEDSLPDKLSFEQVFGNNRIHHDKRVPGKSAHGTKAKGKVYRGVKKSDKASKVITKAKSSPIMSPKGLKRPIGKTSNKRDSANVLGKRHYKESFSKRSPDFSTDRKSSDKSSPNVASDIRSSDNAYYKRSPNFGSGRSLDKSLDKRSPSVASDIRSSDKASYKRSPNFGSGRSLDKSLDKRSPSVASDIRSSDKVSYKRSPNFGWDRRSLDKSLDKRSPSVASDIPSSDKAAYKRSPNFSLDRRYSDTSLDKRFLDKGCDNIFSDKTWGKRSTEQAWARAQSEANIQQKILAFSLSKQLNQLRHPNFPLAGTSKKRAGPLKNTNAYPKHTSFLEMFRNEDNLGSFFHGHSQTNSTLGSSQRPDSIVCESEKTTGNDSLGTTTVDVLNCLLESACNLKKLYDQATVETPATVGAIRRKHNNTKFQPYSNIRSIREGLVKMGKTQERKNVKKQQRDESRNKKAYSESVKFLGPMKGKIPLTEKPDLENRKKIKSAPPKPILTHKVSKDHFKRAHALITQPQGRNFVHESKPLLQRPKMSINTLKYFNPLRGQNQPTQKQLSPDHKLNKIPTAVEKLNKTPNQNLKSVESEALKAQQESPLKLELVKSFFNSLLQQNNSPLLDATTSGDSAEIVRNVFMVEKLNSILDDDGWGGKNDLTAVPLTLLDKGTHQQLSILSMPTPTLVSPTYCDGTEEKETIEKTAPVNLKTRLNQQDPQRVVPKNNVASERNKIQKHSRIPLYKRSNMRTETNETKTKQNFKSIIRNSENSLSRQSNVVSSDRNVIPKLAFPTKTGDVNTSEEPPRSDNTSNNLLRKSMDKTISENVLQSLQLEQLIKRADQMISKSISPIPKSVQEKVSVSEESSVLKNILPLLLKKTQDSTHITPENSSHNSGKNLSSGQNPEPNDGSGRSATKLKDSSCALLKAATLKMDYSSKENTQSKDLPAEEKNNTGLYMKVSNLSGAMEETGTPPSQLTVNNKDDPNSSPISNKRLRHICSPDACRLCGTHTQDNTTCEMGNCSQMTSHLQYTIDTEKLLARHHSHTKTHENGVLTRKPKPQHSQQDVQVLAPKPQASHHNLGLVSPVKLTSQHSVSPQRQTSHQNLKVSPQHQASLLNLKVSPHSEASLHILKVTPLSTANHHNLKVSPSITTSQQKLDALSQKQDNEVVLLRSAHNVTHTVPNPNLNSKLAENLGNNLPLDEKKKPLEIKGNLDIKRHILQQIIDSIKAQNTLLRNQHMDPNGNKTQENSPNGIKGEEGPESIEPQQAFREPSPMKCQRQPSLPASARLESGELLLASLMGQIFCKSEQTSPVKSESQRTSNTPVPGYQRSTKSYTMKINKDSSATKSKTSQKDIQNNVSHIPVYRPRPRDAHKTAATSHGGRTTTHISTSMSKLVKSFLIISEEATRTQSKNAHPGIWPIKRETTPQMSSTLRPHTSQRNPDTHLQKQIRTNPFDNRRQKPTKLSVTEPKKATFTKHASQRYLTKQTLNNNTMHFGSHFKNVKPKSPIFNIKQAWHKAKMHANEQVVLKQKPKAYKPNLLYQMQPRHSIENKTDSLINGNIGFINRFKVPKNDAKSIHHTKQSFTKQTKLSAPSRRPDMEDPRGSKREKVFGNEAKYKQQQYSILHEKLLNARKYSVHQHKHHATAYEQRQQPAISLKRHTEYQHRQQRGKSPPTDTAYEQRHQPEVSPHKYHDGTHQHRREHVSPHVNSAISRQFYVTSQSPKKCSTRSSQRRSGDFSRSDQTPSFEENGLRTVIKSRAVLDSIARNEDRIRKAKGANAKPTKSYFGGFKKRFPALRTSPSSHMASAEHKTIDPNTRPKPDRISMYEVNKRETNPHAMFNTPLRTSYEPVPKFVFDKKHSYDLEAKQEQDNALHNYDRTQPKIMSPKMQPMKGFSEVFINYHCKSLLSDQASFLLKSASKSPPIPATASSSEYVQSRQNKVPDVAAETSFSMVGQHVNRYERTLQENKIKSMGGNYPKRHERAFEEDKFNSIGMNNRKRDDRTFQEDNTTSSGVRHLMNTDRTLQDDIGHVTDTHRPAELYEKLFRSAIKKMNNSSDTVTLGNFLDETSERNTDYELRQYRTLFNEGREEQIIEGERNRPYRSASKTDSIPCLASSPKISASKRAPRRKPKQRKKKRMFIGSGKGVSPSNDSGSQSSDGRRPREKLADSTTQSSRSKTTLETPSEETFIMKKKHGIDSRRSFKKRHLNISTEDMSPNMNGTPTGKPSSYKRRRYSKDAVGSTSPRSPKESSLASKKLPNRKHFKKARKYYEELGNNAHKSLKKKKSSSLKSESFPHLLSSPSSPTLDKGDGNKTVDYTEKSKNSRANISPKDASRPTYGNFENNFKVVTKSENEMNGVNNSERNSAKCDKTVPALNSKDIITKVIKKETSKDSPSSADIVVSWLAHAQDTEASMDKLTNPSIDDILSLPNIDRKSSRDKVASKDSIPKPNSPKSTQNSISNGQKLQDHQRSLGQEHHHDATPRSNNNNRIDDFDQSARNDNAGNDAVYWWSRFPNFTDDPVTLPRKVRPLSKDKRRLATWQYPKVIQQAKHYPIATEQVKDYPIRAKQVKQYPIQTQQDIEYPTYTNLKTARENKLTHISTENTRNQHFSAGVGKDTQSRKKKGSNMEKLAQKNLPIKPMAVKLGYGVSMKINRGFRALTGKPNEDIRNLRESVEQKDQRVGRNEDRSDEMENQKYGLEHEKVVVGDRRGRAEEKYKRNVFNPLEYIAHSYSKLRPAEVTKNYISRNITKNNNFFTSVEGCKSDTINTKASPATYRTDDKQTTRANSTVKTEGEETSSKEVRGDDVIKVAQTEKGDVIAGGDVGQGVTSFKEICLNWYKPATTSQYPSKSTLWTQSKSDSDGSTGKSCTWEEGKANNSSTKYEVESNVWEVEGSKNTPWLASQVSNSTLDGATETHLLNYEKSNTSTPRVAKESHLLCPGLSNNSTPRVIKTAHLLCKNVSINSTPRFTSEAHQMNSDKANKSTPQHVGKLGLWRAGKGCTNTPQPTNRSTLPEDTRSVCNRKRKRYEKEDRNPSQHSMIVGSREPVEGKNRANDISDPIYSQQNGVPSSPHPSDTYCEPHREPTTPDHAHRTAHLSHKLPTTLDSFQTPESPAKQEISPFDPRFIPANSSSLFFPKPDTPMTSPNWDNHSPTDTSSSPHYTNGCETYSISQDSTPNNTPPPYHSTSSTCIPSQASFNTSSPTSTLIQNHTPTLRHQHTSTLNHQHTPTSHPQFTPTSHPQFTPTSHPQFTPTSHPQFTPTLTLQHHATPTFQHHSTHTSYYQHTSTLHHQSTPTSHPQFIPTSHHKPAPTFYDQPAPTFYDQPAPTFYDQPAPTFYDQPAPTFYDQPAPTFYDQPAPTFYDQPAPTFYDQPAPTFYDQPAPTFYDQPAPTFYDQPAPTFYDQPAPTFYDQPAPTFYDQPAPTLAHQTTPTLAHHPTPTLYDHPTPDHHPTPTLDHQLPNLQRKSGFSYLFSDPVQTNDTQTQEKYPIIRVRPVKEDTMVGRIVRMFEKKLQFRPRPNVN